MRKLTVTSFATTAFVAPIALLFVAMPSTPAGAVKAGEAAAACKKNSNCVGTWAPNGGWTGIVLGDDPNDPKTVTCPPKRDCFMERKGSKQRGNVLGVLKPQTAGLSAGQSGPKKAGAPTTVKVPTTSQPSGSAKRR
jgi:hypothetical protein